MYRLKAVAKNLNDADHYFICDAEADLSEIQIGKAPMGSKCYVIDTGKTYILNSKKEWKEYMGGINSSSGSGSGGNISGAIIYDGGSSTGD